MRPSDEALSAWRALLEIHQRLTGEMDRNLRAEHDMPLQWYDVLVHLTEAGGPLRMHELAERALFSRTECTRVVARMDAAGLVAKRRDPDDGRGVYVDRTAAGEQAFRAAARTHRADIEHLFVEPLGSEDAAFVSRALGRVAAAD